MDKHYENVLEIHNNFVTKDTRYVPDLDDFILRTELSFTSPTVTTQIQDQESIGKKVLPLEPPVIFHHTEVGFVTARASVSLGLSLSLVY